MILQEESLHLSLWQVLSVMPHNLQLTFKGNICARFGYGVLVDYVMLSPMMTSLLFGIMSVFITCLWILYFWYRSKQTASEDNSKGNQVDAELLEARET